MANIKIHFDNKKYPVDKSSLTSSISQLKSHLTTVMNGSGATVDLDGDSYGVDSNQLSNTANSLASHFGTISGSGIRVLLNGVEYLLDKDKLANATLDLHTVLGLLNPTKPPEKNQYGFYFGVPYYFINPETGNRMGAVVFLEDGNALSFGPPSYELDSGEDNTILVASEYFQTINYDTNLVLNDGRYAMSYNYNLCGFSEDGSIMYNTYFIGDENNDDDWQDSTKYAILESECAIAELTEREHGIYFGRTYVSNAGDILIPYESNKCFTKYIDGNEYTTRLEGWKTYNHYSQEYAMRLYSNIDSTVICYGSSYGALKFYYLQELDEQLKTPMLTIVNETLNISPVANATSYEVYREDALLTTTEALSVDLSQYIDEKNTYVMVRALREGHEPSAFACVKYGIDMIPGTYATGAINLYKTQGADAVESMLINSWGELVLKQLITQSNTTLSDVSETIIKCELILPDYITTIGQKACYDVSTITGVLLPDKLDAIEEQAFWRCQTLATVHIPDNVTSIGQSAFFECYRLKSVVVPDGVTELVDTFNSCYSLETVSLPSSLTKLQYTFVSGAEVGNIVFRGTMDQWNAIEKSSWNSGNPIHVQCTDGSIEVNSDKY